VDGAGRSIAGDAGGDPVGKALAADTAMRYTRQPVMKIPSFHLERSREARAGGMARTAADVLLIIALIALVIAISACAPSNTYRFAQFWQVGAAIDIAHGGHWLLPQTQVKLFRKPPLYAWLLAPILRLTGVHEDIIFRLPNIAASLALGLMVYALGRRWYGRRVGLLAACLWATSLHMSKLMYLALTDMLLAAWIAGAILCADRLLFHPAPRGSQRRWAVGLWACMVLGALTKGWGLVNLAIVATIIALAAVLGPGFRALRAAPRPEDELPLLGRIVLRRLRAAARATRLGRGLLAFLLVMVPLWCVMVIQGGQEFRDVIYFELHQRITGTGPSPPSSASQPAVVYLFYYLLPVSLFAVSALLIAGPRRWLSRRSPLALPVYWVVAVAGLFSIPHGFRPDYLLPCYPAAALLAAWAIEAVQRRGTQGGALAHFCRHLFGFASVAAGAVLVAGGVCFLPAFGLTGAMEKVLDRPPFVPPQTQAGLWAMIPFGIFVIVLGVWAGLTWRLRVVAAAAVLGMVGVAFLNRHMISPSARSGDGEKMLRFARDARRVIGEEPFAVYRASKLGTEAYIGRLADLRPSPMKALRKLNRSSIAWLITSDRGLIEMGAYRTLEEERVRPALVAAAATVMPWLGGLDPEGTLEHLRFAGRGGGHVHRLDMPRGRVHFRTLPGVLGRVRVVGDDVRSQRWGRAYLIELRRPLRALRRGWYTPHSCGADDDE
jgi:4-amino-4-deoxy-L-arabinose transferase-like glycosyltransferase